MPVFQTDLPPLPDDAVEQERAIEREAAHWRARINDSEAERRLVYRVSCEAVLMMVHEVGWHLDRLLERMAFMQVENRADGSGGVPADLLDEVNLYSHHLADMVTTAQRRELEYLDLLPPRLRLDFTPGVTKLSFNIMRQ